MRHYPRDRALRTLVPAGIELAPPRREVSTGPGRHDFEIVVDPAAPVEEDLGRRDFTINAMARRLADGARIDPYGGEADLEGASPAHGLAVELRRGSRCASCAGFASSRSSISIPTTRRSRRCAKKRAACDSSRASGSAAACTQTGMGELSKLLLGTHPAKALRIARDTGVLVELLPEFEPAIGFQQESRYHDLTVDEHTFAVVQAAADARRLARRPPRRALPRPRQAARRVARDRRPPPLLREARYSARSHEQVSAELAAQALSRLRYPNELRSRVIRIVRAHMFDPARSDPVRARGACSRATAAG